MHGFHATSVQSLVSYLGINRSSLYESFESKEELFREALDTYCKEAKEGVRALLSQEINTKQGIKKLLEGSIVCTIIDPEKKGCFVVNTTAAITPEDGELIKALQKNRTHFEQVFYEFLLKGQQSGDIAADKNLRSLAGLIYTLFSGFSIIAKVEKKPEVLVAQVDLILGLLD